LNHYSYFNLVLKLTYTSMATLYKRQMDQQKWIDMASLTIQLIVKVICVVEYN